MSSPKISTIKRLFAVSGNKCAFPDCLSPIAEISGTVTGEVAHIKAAKAKGPRYDGNQTEEERHCFSNLILLCSRHHTIIDSEVKNYTVETLVKMKKDHETAGVVEINKFTADASSVLLQNYSNISVRNSSGNVAVNSPGAMQAKTIHNYNNSKPKITVSPPDGTVSSVLEMCSYIDYLITKYKDFQKQDKSKGDYKYMAIYNAIKREFGSKWQLIPSKNYTNLETFLHTKLLNTKVGRIRNKRGQKVFHSFEEHCDKIGS